MIENVLEVMGRWLHIEDRQGIEIILATAVASQFPGDPLWFFIIGPPGSCKTEICRSFRGSSRVICRDMLTPKSLVSGFKVKKEKEQEYNLLPRLNGKLLVLKDFTTMLSRPSLETTEIFGTLRGIYDGFYEASYGSGVTRQYESIFGIIAAVTPRIDEYGKIQSLLGERFLRLRERYDRHKATQSALKHSGQEIIARREIGDAMQTAFDWYVKLFKPPATTSQTSRKIEYLADVTSILRTGVERDYQRRVKYIPEAEVPTRLSKQLHRLAQCLFIMGVYTYQHLVRVAEDTVPSGRLEFIRAVREGCSTHQAIVNKTHLPTSVIEVTGEDLWILKAVDRSEKEEGKAYQYIIKRDFAEALKIAEL